MGETAPSGAFGANKTKAHTWPTLLLVSKGQPSPATPPPVLQMRRAVVGGPTPQPEHCGPVCAGRGGGPHGSCGDPPPPTHDRSEVIGPQWSGRNVRIGLWPRLPPTTFHRPPATLVASHSFRSTDVFWPVPALKMVWVALIGTPSGQTYVLVRGHSLTGR